MDTIKRVKRAIAGDSDAYIQLVKELEASLYPMAKSLLGSDEDVADALQETVLKAYQALPTLREPKYFKTWMFRILINECRSIVAKRSRAKTYAEVPETATEVPADDYAKVDLREAVERLDESQRIVVILHYYEDMPLREVARALDLSESAVKMRLMRARDALQKMLASFREGRMNYDGITH